MIMTPDHRIKGRAAGNVLDLVDTTLVHVREPTNLLQNSASVKAYRNLRNPEATVFVVLFCIHLPCFTTKKMVHGLYKKSGALLYRSFYYSIVKNVC